MRFAIEHEAMNGPEAVLNLLDSLLARAEDDIHELEILDADLLENSTWYASCRPERRKLLEKSAEAFATPLSPHSRTALAPDGDSWRGIR